MNLTRTASAISKTSALLNGFFHQPTLNAGCPCGNMWVVTTINQGITCLARMNCIRI